MSKHTPIPWTRKIIEFGNQEFQRIHPLIHAGHGYVARLMCKESTMTGMSSGAPSLDEANANADFIVRAVNCHAALLNACQMWADYFDNLDEISDPNDPLTIARTEFHRKRMDATRAAIAITKASQP